MTLPALTPQQAQVTIRDYVCSNCWGHLVAYHAQDRKTIVKCHKCGDDTKGYVTKTFVERYRAENMAEAYEVHELLDSLGIVEKPHKDKNPEQLLDELGF